MAPAVHALSGVPRASLVKELSTLPSFRATQIFKWIASGAHSFDEMLNLPASLREELKLRYAVFSSSQEECFFSEDGTKKIRVSLEDGLKIESVLLADLNNRLTACLSSQAGCPAACVFCKTGALGFRRNLSSSEIVEQFLFLRKLAGENPIANIVVMGMGEPLLNLPNLRQAIAVINDPQGLNFSKRRITVSTCGIHEGIIDLADNGPDVRLALSLVTADEELRRRLMPMSRGHSLEQIKNALVYFQQSGGGRVTLELVLLGGVNTRQEDASALAQFARGLDAAINLIPWNPFEQQADSEFQLKEPGLNEVAAFSRRLESLNLNVTLRHRRGRSISGACGQLGCVNAVQEF